jgi:hypothetical protein
MGNKKILGEAGRWLRVSVLTASTIGPLVGTVLTRLREQQIPGRNTSVVVDRVPPVVLVEDTPEKPSFSDSLVLLRERAYNQELVHRAEELAEELRQRAGKLSLLLTDRGSDLTHELSKRSSDLTHELSKRGSDLTRDLSKQSEEVSRNLRKQTRKVSHDLSKQSEEMSRNLRKQTRKVSQNIAQQERSTLWIISGFSVGLIAASVTAFILIRSRLQRQQEQEEDEHILLAQNDHAEMKNGAVAPVVLKENPRESATPATVAVGMKSASTPALNGQAASNGHAVPADAVFLGVASTKHYYPVQTPLDQLDTHDQPLTIVYFTSEEEAKAQGFTATDK